jgi:hypothetical protein
VHLLQVLDPLRFGGLGKGNKGRFGGGNSCAGIFFITQRYLAGKGIVGGVYQVESLCSMGRYKSPVDIELVDSFHCSLFVSTKVTRLSLACFVV